MGQGSTEPSLSKVGLPRPCGLSRPSPLESLEALFEEDGLQRDGSKSCPALEVLGCFHIVSIFFMSKRFMCG